MSAIAGILNFNGAPVERRLIEKLTGAMAARGPDEQTHWVQGSVALGHCMLRTTPESIDEHQPLMSQDKKLTLVWDGRLDNRDELRRALIAGGAVLRDNSDAELALQSFAAWGEECPTRLLGDFAFAVWDAVRNCLFCARDHMGARPFFYVRNGAFFAFASEEEALTRVPGVSGRPNEELIAYLLVPTFRDFNYSRAWLEDVWTLPAAGRMTVSSDGLGHPQTYWQLEPGEESSYASDEECQEAFLEVFGEAVRCRLRSSGDVAAMMSGGLDSASIAAMVKRVLPGMPGKQFHTYSAISDHPETCVESRAIQSLTADLGDRAHFVSVPSFTGMLEVQDLVDVGWSSAHPVDNSILLPAMMCRAASRDGHRVMLHGVGGDLTMHAPNRYIAHILRAGRWRQAWNECQSASRNFTYLRGTSLAMLLLLNAGTAYAPGGLKVFMRWLRSRRAGSPLKGKLVNGRLAEKFRMVEHSRAMARGTGAPLPSLQQLHIQALSPPHGITCGLEGYDRVAGRYGVEFRDPWSDKRVVEFFLRLPLQHKVREGWTKHLARTAFAADLEAGVRWRIGKEHLGWNFTCRLMDESRDVVARSLQDGLDAVAQYVDVQAVDARHAEYRTSRGDDDRQNIYDTMTLMLWMRRISS